MLINSVNIKVISAIIITLAGFISSISIVFLSIAIDVVWFISLSIVILPSNTRISYYS